MIAQASIETSPPADQAPLDVDTTQETQRGRGGLLMELLFPLIALTAIAFAGYELVR